jgi:predicted transcriptional regulator
MTKPEPGFEEEPSVFDQADTAADEAAAILGEQDYRAGRTISHEAMKRWLLSWGTASELPPPKCGE